MTVTIEPVSYSYETASAATGISADMIRRAVAAGDLTPRYVTVAGRKVAKPVIEREELARWVAAGSTERTDRT